MSTLDVHLRDESIGTLVKRARPGDYAFEYRAEIATASRIA